MSARSRAEPWFGTKGERSERPENPPGVDDTMIIEAEWLRDFATPADLRARAENAFVEATLRLFQEPAGA